MNKRPKNCLTCGKPKMPYGGGPLTSSGAKEMLRDNSAHGHKLTPKQKRYFGYIAGGGKPKKQDGGAIDVNKFRRNTMIPGQDIPSGDPAMQYGNIQIPQQHDIFKPGVDIPYKDPAMEGYKPQDRLQEAISKGIFQQPKDFTSPAAWYDYMNTPAPKGIPKKPNPFALRVGYEGVLTGLNAIAGGVERSRQNQYKESQYASLGQEDPIPVSNYQQNPYSLYSRYGGRIKLQKGGKDPNSVVDFLSGTRLGNSFDQRASYFGDLVGGEHYTGSADQNIKLMSALKANPKYFGTESGIQTHPQVASSRNIPAILGPQQSSGFSAAPSSTAQYLGLHPTKPNTASNTVTDSRSMSDLWRTGLTPNPVQSPSQGMVSPVAASNKLQSGVVVDKRKNIGYIIQDGKKTNQFNVLTGKNPDLNRNDYSMLSLELNSNLRNTPQGNYQLSYDPNTYGHPGFAMNPISAYGKEAPKVSDLFVHQTYDPAVRNKLYGTPGSHVSYGCINLQGEALQKCLQAFPQGDTLRVVDTKMQEGKDVLSQYGIKRMGGALSKKKKYGSNSKYQTVKKDPVDADDELKSGGWIKSAAASIKRRGTEGKCTPITKPGCTGRARALALTFKKIARNRKHK